MKRVLIKNCSSSELSENPSFSWRHPNPHLWVLIYNGDSLTYLTQSNNNYYSADIIKGGEYSIRASSLSAAKTKAINLTRKHFPDFRKYQQSQPTVEYINKHINKAVIAKHGLAVRVSPVAFKPLEYRIYFADGYTQETKIPKRNPSKSKTMRERCEEILHGKDNDMTFSYYRDVENPNSDDSERIAKESLKRSQKRLHKGQKHNAFMLGVIAYASNKSKEANPFNPVEQPKLFLTWLKGYRH